MGASRIDRLGYLEIRRIEIIFTGNRTTKKAATSNLFIPSFSCHPTFAKTIRCGQDRLNGELSLHDKELRH